MKYSPPGTESIPSGQTCWAEAGGSVWIEQSAGDVLRLVLSLTWIGLIVAVMAAIVTRYRTTAPGVTKQQIKLAIFGFVTGFLCFLISGGAFLAQNSVEIVDGHGLAALPAH